ncbi:hypothetical protein [Mesorhizobium sp. GR13]|uniref:hypothetical protein n=1 Tax=Mesorhizobium sp. GR13 TaxID=2562308 RepID=UPI001484D142|nr:hypothetical protein [Mesorhizobium sp. GR13]
MLSAPCGLTSAYAANFSVTNTSSSGPGSLAEALNLANGNSGSDTITIQDNLGTIPLQNLGGGATFPYLISDDVVIDGGAGNTVNGAGVGRVFLVAGQTPGTNINVTLSNLAITGGIAQGGAAGFAGGGGMGAGGALLISDGNVTLANVTFTSNDAVGGNGGGSAVSAIGGGGGGGLGGNGASGGNIGGGGGGGSLPGANGGNSTGLNGGNGGTSERRRWAFGWCLWSYRR